MKHALSVRADGDGAEGVRRCILELLDMPEAQVLIRPNPGYRGSAFVFDLDANIGTGE